MFPLHSSLVRHTWVLCPVLGSPVQDRHGCTKAHSAKGHKGDSGIEPPLRQDEAERAGTVQPGGDKAQGNLVYTYIYIHIPNSRV